MENSIKVRLCSSLAKVFPTREPMMMSNDIPMALRGETLSFQVAYYSTNLVYFYGNLTYQAPWENAVRVRQVNLVPVELPTYETDEDYESLEPGLYPDRISELEDGRAPFVLNQWRSLWVTIDIPKDCAPGIYSLPMQMTGFSDSPIPDGYCCEWSGTFKFEVLGATLPEQTLKFTNWFYCDCLAVHYNLQVFSEEHWTIIENFVRGAVKYGMNMLLTPVFTPPLDTKIGSERPTVQLIGVRVDDLGKYHFDFSLLERWVSMAQRAGIKYFEISHLFSQWGAHATPKVIATVNGEDKRIFGWDVPAASKEYTDFLEAFLPELVAWLKAHDLLEKTYFHCSDEPCANDIDDYTKCAKLLQRLLPGCNIMDAMSEVENYRNGLVKIPVPIECKLYDFLQEELKERWVYYCCGPAVTYSNRLIAMPSARNRILGSQLYYYDIQGFLHWGFNFYFTRQSVAAIDPFRSTDSGGLFPAGDAFIVYPGKDGRPEDSIRGIVFTEALQDQRAMQLLETLTSRAQIQAYLDASVPEGKFSMENYPKGAAPVNALRAGINRMIKEALAATAK